MIQANGITFGASLLFALIVLCVYGCGTEPPPKPSEPLPKTSDVIKQENPSTVTANSGRGEAAVIAESDRMKPDAAQPNSIRKDIVDGSARPQDSMSARPDREPIASLSGDPVPIDSSHAEPVPSNPSEAESSQTDSASADVITADSVSPKSTFQKPELHGEPARIYLPTAAGPLLVDLHIHIDGQSQQQLFDEQFEKVINDATEGIDVADDDQLPRRLDWPRLFDFVSEDPDRFGPVMRSVGNQRNELVRRYDTNRNKRVDVGELVKFLFRDARENVAFRVRGTDYFRSRPTSRSNLFAMLDADGDGILNTTERDHATETLFRLDQNGDQQLRLSEIDTVAGDDNEVWGRRRTSRHGDVAMDLEGFVDWNLVSYSLDSMRDGLPFGLRENVIAGLDGDGNGETSSSEAERLIECEPHLHLLAEYRTGGRPRLSFIATHLGASKTDGASRIQFDDSRRGQLTMADDRLRLTVQVIDRTDQQDRIPRQAFDQIDANDDGFLDATEIPDLAADALDLDELDQDGDEKLTIAEVNRRKDSTVPVWAYQVRGRAVEAADQLFCWLDRNQDQVLSSRELDSAQERIQMLSSGKPNLAPADIPVGFVLKIVRGNPAQDAESFRQAMDVPSSQPLPGWATQMDTNGDREISRFEFIGTGKQFDRLDSDQDGFIDAHEIQTIPEN